MSLQLTSEWRLNLAGKKATDGQESPHLTVKLLPAVAPMKQLVAPMRKRCRQNKSQTCDHRGKTSKGGVLTLDLSPRVLDDLSSGLVH